MESRRGSSDEGIPKPRQSSVLAAVLLAGTSRLLVTLLLPICRLLLLLLLADVVVRVVVWVVAVAVAGNGAGAGAGAGLLGEGWAVAVLAMLVVMTMTMAMTMACGIGRWATVLPTVVGVCAPRSIVRADLFVTPLDDRLGRRRVVGVGGDVGRELGRQVRAPTRGRGRREAGAGAVAAALAVLRQVVAWGQEHVRGRRGGRVLGTGGQGASSLAGLGGVVW